MNVHQGSSVRNNIIIAFVLVILTWGIAVNISFQYIHETLLRRYSIDPDVMREMIRNFIVMSSAMTMVIIAIALVISLHLSNRITLPIKSLTEGALEVAHGNLDVSIVVDNRDELGLLAETFNRMIVQRKHAEKTIKKSLKEKEILLKEIHHRVKNNLAIISSLLSLQARKVQGTKNIRVFEDSRNRIRAMSMIHERLYQSRDLAHIDVREYFQTLIDNLLTSYGGVKGNVEFDVDIDVGDMHIDKLIPCGLILNELVSNALKYAFLETEDGRIRVSMKAENGTRTLTVWDNGDGIPGELDILHTETLGLQIVNSLVVQMRGEIKLDRSEGTRYTIVFNDKGNTSYLEN